MQWHSTANLLESLKIKKIIHIQHLGEFGETEIWIHCFGGI